MPESQPPFLLPPAPRTLLVDRPVGMAPIGSQATLIPMIWPEKDPADTVVYGLDFTLAAAGTAFGPIEPTIIVISPNAPFGTPTKHKHRCRTETRLCIVQAEATATDPNLIVANCRWDGLGIAVTLKGGTPSMIEDGIVTVIALLNDGERLRRTIRLKINPIPLPPPVAPNLLTLNGMPVTIGHQPIGVIANTDALLIDNEPITIGGRPIFLE